jgi:glycosyltransferase involved in cell wall biosynthesis
VNLVGNKNNLAHRYAFVVPRCGQGIAGGAETLVRELAERLSSRGNPIEILTTCAKDNRTWQNFFTPGESTENGVLVRRFAVSERDLDSWVPLQIKLSQGLRLSVEEEVAWMTHSVNSYDLYEYIKSNSHKYRALFFAPYLFGTTFWGSLIDPARSILIPCLHDESYAYTNVIASMFRLTKGCLFNALPEKWLAQSLYGEVCGDEVGMGFDPVEYKVRTAESKVPSRYILYVGRKETGKNLHLLVDYFIASKLSNQIDSDVGLVIVGGGDFSDINRPKAKNRNDIFDLAHVSEEEKKALLQNAICLIQPSTNESFSIVLMEAWQLKTPVVVHARCPVTKYHVEQSNGGLYFGSEAEFALVLNKIINDPELAKSFGHNGDKYVATQYNWSAVLARFDQTVDNIINS